MHHKHHLFQPSPRTGHAPTASVLRGLAWCMALSAPSLLLQPELRGAAGEAVLPPSARVAARVQQTGLSVLVGGSKRDEARSSTGNNGSSSRSSSNAHVNHSSQVSISISRNESSEGSGASTDAQELSFLACVLSSAALLAAAHAAQQLQGALTQTVTDAHSSVSAVAHSSLPLHLLSSPLPQLLHALRVLRQHTLPGLSDRQLHALLVDHPELLLPAGIISQSVQPVPSSQSVQQSAAHAQRTAYAKQHARGELLQLRREVQALVGCETGEASQLVARYAGVLLQVNKGVREDCVA